MAPLPPRRDLGVLAAAALLSFGLPALLAARVHARVDATAARWSQVLGAEVRVGGAEVGLTGTLRLTDVRVGDAFAAEAVEAGVALTSLLAGRFGADEVRVHRPRLRARVDESGQVDLAVLARRARDARRAKHPGAPGGAGSHAGLRRVIVTGGELALSLEGRGEIRARGVELHPQEGGVRVIAGGVSLALVDGAWHLDGEFARTGLDVSLPELRVERAALAGGDVRVSAGSAAPLVLAHVVVTRDAAQTRLEGRVGGPSGPPLAARLGRDGAGARVVELSAEQLPLGAFGAALPSGLDFAHAVAGGRALVTVGARAIHVSGKLDVRGLAARHAVLAAHAVPLAGQLAGEATWERDAREGRASFHVTTGGLTMHGELELALASGGAWRSGRLFLELPELACADALAAVPVPLREPLDGLVVDGRIGGTVELGFDRSGRAPAIFEVDLANRCRVVEDAPAAAVDRLAGAYAHTLPGAAGVRTLAPSDPSYAAIDELPAHVVQAFVAGEDARFFVHHGFDLEQLRRSFEVDMIAGRVERGGSTISQQLVKNLFLTRERTLSRKLLEAVLTWRLETRLGKRRILEVYLNVIELGEGIYGLEPAAQHWFGKPASKLDVPEAAFLAALTPAPLSSNRRIRALGTLDPETRGRVDAVLRSMRRNRYLDAPSLNRYLRTPLALRAGALAAR